MDRVQYEAVECYMHSCMEDSAHDREHVYRVLYTALWLAEKEEKVDRDVLICACLLHDIGRKEQFADPGLCHAQIGGEKAYGFLLSHGYPESFSRHVKACIQTHRFRENSQPESLEAKILFDADKLDVAGALGIARTLLYQGYVSTPLYSVTPDGEISDGTVDGSDSFFQEYKYKLETMYDRFYTEAGRSLALARKPAAESYYRALLQEVRQTRGAGKAALDAVLCK